jgi:hypothetical protein
MSGEKEKPNWRCPVCHSYDDKEEILDAVRCSDCDRLVCDGCIQGNQAGSICDQCAFLVDLFKPVMGSDSDE